MLCRRSILTIIAGVLACLSVQAQQFETRSTRYSGKKILKKLNESGNEKLLAIRDSVMETRTASLISNDIIETFYNDHHMGLVIYRDKKPHELIGFWDPKGNPVDGGNLTNGNGEIKTPFNPDLIKNFKNETVMYASGVKNGACFYYCDCASVLRKGTFTNNAKGGLWIEYHADGSFIRQEEIKLPEPKEVKDDIKINDWRQPAHCMMRPDLDKCPDPIGGGQ